MSARGRTKTSPGIPIRSRVSLRDRHPRRAPAAADKRDATSRLSLQWSPFAWGSILAAGIFIALTCWWLSEDSAIPIYDAGNHLWAAIHYHDLISAGDLLGPFNYTWQYPPLGHTIGALAAFVGGVNVAAPIIGENLVFVSLLTLGCYQAGKLLFGPLAGMLAAIFALGSPLLIAQFHVFMLDAPETAVVAVSIWLILASDRFANVKMSAFAGLAVAAGLLIKVQFPFFILGIVLTALALGGWRNRRGVLTFAGVAILFGSPWYIRHLSELHAIFTLAGAGSGAVSNNLPPTFSIHNLTWYVWTILESQLLLPLFLLLAVGTVWTLTRLVRKREWRGPRLEFVIGGFIAWLAITLTPHHDLRYGMPLIPYLALMATGWIVSAPRAARIAAVSLLAAGVACNTLGLTFGAGPDISLDVGSSAASTYLLPGAIPLYTTHGFLVSGPSRDGNVPALLVALRRNGVTTIGIDAQEGLGPVFSFEGLRALALIARLKYIVTRERIPSESNTAAFLVNAKTYPGGPPCVTLSDGTGVFVLRGTASGEPMLYCPFRHPQYY